MNFNTDGFNERTNYISNANDINRLKKMGTNNIDNSVVKMRIEENKPDIKTATFDKKIQTEETRGSKDKFMLRNYNILKANLCFMFFKI